MPDAPYAVTTTPVPGASPAGGNGVVSAPGQDVAIAGTQQPASAATVADAPAIDTPAATQAQVSDPMPSRVEPAEDKGALLSDYLKIGWHIARHAPGIALRFIDHSLGRALRGVLEWGKALVAEPTPTVSQAAVSVPHDLTQHSPVGCMPPASGSTAQLPTVSPPPLQTSSLFGGVLLSPATLPVTGHMQTFASAPQVNIAVGSPAVSPTSLSAASAFPLLTGAPMGSVPVQTQATPGPAQVPFSIVPSSSLGVAGGKPQTQLPVDPSPKNLSTQGPGRAGLGR